ncbi:MAG: GntP family permease [Lachnospiraceae bacterium]|jgi:H+/gluconate symporter-like permease|nr:GntP family permease [Lachnospiraceae bacterium]
MQSLIGIIGGLGIFVLLAYRGFNLVFSAVISSCVMFICSGIGILEGLNEIYLPGLASFLKNYFLIFFLSALMGKLMSDGGNAKRIALSLSSLIKKSRNHQQFFCVLMVPVFYFFLCYAGISGFVVVFTVLPIAKNLYEETNTPWYLYCCAGAQTISASYLAGSLQAGNVYAADVCGTTLTAGWVLSLVAAAVFWAVSLIMLWAVLQRAVTRGETFFPSGSGIANASLDEGLPEETLPKLLPSLLPLAAVIVLSTLFQVNVAGALAAGCLWSVIIGRKNLLPKLKESLEGGIASVYGPILSVSATYAIGEVLKSLEGFSYIESIFERLPGLLGAPLLGVAMAFIMASVAAPVPAFGSKMLEHYALAGISAENAHRMMMITSFTSIAPHNAGISNAASVLRLPYGKCLKMYMLFTYVPGVITLFVCLFFLKTGIIT